MRTVTILVGYVLIYIAVEYKRTKECIYGPFTKEWLIQVILVTIGGTMLLSAFDS